MAEGGDKCHGQPMSARRLGAQGLSLARPAMGRRHIGLGPGLIDEDEAFGRWPLLILLPLLAAIRNIRPILLAGEYGFF